MKVTGKIHFVGALRTVSEKFKSKDVVIVTDDKFPQYITIQFTQDKTDLVNPEDVGDQVEVSINLRGREWKSPTGEIKYFNTIEGWQINSVQSAVENKGRQALKETIIQESNFDNDDLPF
jgi:single-strand DNA-binding protein